MTLKRIFKNLYLLLFYITIANHLFCQVKDPKIFTLQFLNRIGNDTLQLNKIYTNTLGENFSISSCRYYISNIVLEDKKNNLKEEFSDQYFLVDQADRASQTILLTSSLKEVTNIRFMIGIDSIKNVQGVQEGVLDPAKGMFWVWNSGYIMAKLEGNSTLIKAPRHAFSLHIGGFRQGENTARTVLLEFKKGCDTIQILADINHWFNSRYKLPLQENYFCHEPGNLAMKYADNYSTMFSVPEN
ncbi:MAG: hypothetical protein JSS67_09255 [Bacteroidetes bacterium]|nr:hypothetical protein [Bacteroidota bacterium]